jgi:transcription elongation factor Elf1
VNTPRGEDNVSRGNEIIARQSEETAIPVACPKCGSSRTAVTVNIVDDTVHLTLYCCGTCEHRFSRSAR